MLIYPVASGKGGVGKSLFSTNISIALSKMGKKVVVADLDLGGSNIHLILGIMNTKSGVGSFLAGEKNIDELLVQTEYENLYFLPGDGDTPGLANLNVLLKKKLIRGLMSLKADYVIVDLGAGSSLNTIDFYLISNSGIMVTTPAPTSIVNAYLFLKNVVYRMMQNIFPKESKASKYINNLKKSDNSNLSFNQLERDVANIDSDSWFNFKEELSKFNVNLILNMIEDPKDARKVNHLKITCKQYLNLEINHLGVIYRDDLQDTALSSRLPILIYKPKSVLSQAIYRIGEKIIQKETEEGNFTKYGSQIVSSKITNSTEDFYQEAEQDFQNKIEYVQDLLNIGALSMGDLVETIKNQQIEIENLKKQNTLYKSKILKAIKEGYKI